MYGFKILCEISKGTFEISYKILNPYTAKYAFYCFLFLRACYNIFESWRHMRLSESHFIVEWLTIVTLTGKLHRRMQGKCDALIQDLILRPQQNKAKQHCVHIDGLVQEKRDFIANHYSDIIMGAMAFQITSPLWSLPCWFMCKYA